MQPLLSVQSHINGKVIKRHLKEVKMTNNKASNENLHNLSRVPTKRNLWHRHSPRHTISGVFKKGPQNYNHHSSDQNQQTV